MHICKAGDKKHILKKLKLTRRLKNKAVVVSFSSPAHTNKDGTELNYEEMLMDEKFTEENFAINADLGHILKDIVPRLSKKERMIFDEYFIKQKTQKEVGKILNMSQMHILHLIKQIKGKILDAYENGVEVLEEEPIETVPTTFEEALSMQKKKNREILIDYYKSDLRCEDVAKKHHSTKAAVTSIAKRFKQFCLENNIDCPRKTRIDLLPDAKAERNKNIYEDYLKGDESIAELAKKYAVSTATIGNVISRAERGEGVQTSALKSDKLLKGVNQIDVETALDGALSLPKEEVSKSDKAEQTVKEQRVVVGIKGKDKEI